MFDDSTNENKLISHEKQNITINTTGKKLNKYVRTFREKILELEKYIQMILFNTNKYDFAWMERNS